MEYKLFYTIKFHLSFIVQDVGGVDMGDGRILKQGFLLKKVA